MKDRLLQLIDIKKLNKIQFYKIIGVANGFLDKNQEIGTSKIEKILNYFPDVNAHWLVTGQGTMLTNEVISVNNNELNVQLERERQLMKKNILLLEDNRRLLDEKIVGLQLDLQECEQQKKLSTNNTDGNQ